MNGEGFGLCQQGIKADAAGFLRGRSSSTLVFLVAVAP